MKKLLTLGLTFVALTSPAFATNWNAYDHQLYQLEKQGYEETVRSVSGSLEEGEVARWTFRGLAGDAYAAFAVCDEDCGAISVRVYDQAGRLVDADDYQLQPIASFSTGRTQTYTVEVEMERCFDTVCTYRMGVAHNDL